MWFVISLTTSDATRLQQEHAYAVAGQENIPQPAHSYVAGYIEYLTPYIVSGHVETGREMARMDTTMLQGLDKTWRATPVSSTLIKQTMGTSSSGSPPRTHAYAFGKSYAGKIV